MSPRSSPHAAQSGLLRCLPTVCRWPREWLAARLHRASRWHRSAGLAHRSYVQRAEHQAVAMDDGRFSVPGRPGGRSDASTQRRVVHAVCVLAAQTRSIEPLRSIAARHARLAYNTGFRRYSIPMIRTRFAPSPTGYLHIGGARTALFSWAYARQHGGKFILRIEDTDRERSTRGSRRRRSSTRCSGSASTTTKGPFYQMQRLARYREVAEQLMRDGQGVLLLRHARKSSTRCARRSARAARSRATTAAGARRTRRARLPPPGVHAGGALQESARGRGHPGRPGEGPDHRPERTSSTTS